MALYTMKESSVDVGGKCAGPYLSQGTVIASDWHDSNNDERVILVLKGRRDYSVRIVKQVRPNDILTWDVLYDETFPSIELAVSGQMEPQPYVYHYGPNAGDPQDAAPWQAGYLDCKERG